VGLRFAYALVMAAAIGQLACGGASSSSPTDPTSGGPGVEVTGTVRDALNGELLSFGMIQRYQLGNPAGDTVYQAPGGYCPYCRWSNGPPGDGRFTFSVLAGTPFTLSVFVVGFEDHVRHFTITEATTVDLVIAPKPVKIQLDIQDLSTFSTLACFPARVEFLDGPNAGHVATFSGGTLFEVEGLQPTDSTLRASAPGYQALERKLKIRPDSDYPRVAGGWVLSLVPASVPVNCAS
jgi:hypothetical protein